VAMVKWLRYWTHEKEIVGSNPAIYWFDVSNKASYYIEKKKN
jgi:hypothetical protein